MKTDTTKDPKRTPEGFFNGFRAWKPLILAAFLPLAVACTDTVTGLDQLAHEEEESDIDQRPGAVDKPVARDLPVAR